jgi:hypothetical protein
VCPWPPPSSHWPAGLVVAANPLVTGATKGPYVMPPAPSIEWRVKSGVLRLRAGGGGGAHAPIQELKPSPPSSCLKFDRSTSASRRQGSIDRAAARKDNEGAMALALIVPGRAIDQEAVQKENAKKRGSDKQKQKAKTSEPEPAHQVYGPTTQGLKRGRNAHKWG